VAGALHREGIETILRIGDLDRRATNPARVRLGATSQGGRAVFSNWLSNIKWLLLLAIVAGPAFAYFSYTEAQAIKRVTAEGVEVTAAVDGAESQKSRRGARTYSVHATWATEAGLQRAEDLAITSDFAGKIIQDDYLVIDSVKVKYLPNDAEAKAVVVDDAAQQIADKEMMTYLGIGGGVLGIIGSACFFLLGRKKKSPAPEGSAA
jgi:Protein of unknown function (DUF3592)